MRQLRQGLQAIPQLLLVQPDQLSYDLAFTLGLTPLILAGLIFFRQDAVLIFATCFLAGVVCLLALQLGRLTLNLPAWVGHKANHPLLASFLIACFLSPHAPLWLAAAAVTLFVLLDTVIWPQLQRVMLHPALIVFGLLFIVERQIGTYFVNPFDGRRLGDPLTLWYHSATHFSTIDPVKVYVGNVPGPVGATSAVAILLGLTYLWYAKKVSLGVIVGFLAGIAVPAAILGSDVAFQLSSGPALFLAGYIAADRRRIAIPERFTFVFGLAAGALTMLLRAYGQGQEAAWQSLLLMSAVVTVYLRVRGLLVAAGQPTGSGRLFRTTPVASGNNEPRPSPGAARRQEVRQPMMAMSPSGAAFTRAPRPVGGFDTATNSNDLVRQMRIAASRGPLKNAAANRLLLGLSLVLLNPLGLWLTWSAGSLAGSTKRLLTIASVVWYLAAAGLVFAVSHIR
ncbi:MAG: RnfABCDGE type electron transport complex subunit D [Candidatus Dormibacteraeota bacterium]|nr:RnfABCDGE type electron transport complex subunit D [Candidatus Dormibacteraeota bacterium]MDQ6882734.1 RnfABCDGE type electron transport complex subunit D [Candidatus Dormibacteraeota bacterium]